MTNIKKLVNDYNEAKNAFETVLKDKSKEVFAQFFIDNPEFRTIEWIQYTPSFNDGDPCRFTRGDVYYTLQPEYYSDDVRETIENYDYSTRDLEEYHPLETIRDKDREYSWMRSCVAEWDALTTEQKQERYRLSGILDGIISVIDSIPDDVAENMFGDGASIRLSKDGVKIEEYYHDY